jgi:hypothetical protein
MTSNATSCGSLCVVWVANGVGAVYVEVVRTEIDLHVLSSIPSVEPASGC